MLFITWYIYIYPTQLTEQDGKSGRRVGVYMECTGAWYKNNVSIRCHAHPRRVSTADPCGKVIPAGHLTALTAGTVTVPGRSIDRWRRHSQLLNLTEISA